MKKNTLIAATSALALSASAQAALIIELAPGNLSVNSGTVTWTNTGSAGGAFTSNANTGVTIGNVSDGSSSAFAVTNTTGNYLTSDFTDSAAGLKGTQVRTTEIWVLNTSPGEGDTAIAWGRRGLSGQNYALGVGNNDDFGAIATWANDAGYSSDNVATSWTHVVWTSTASGNHKVYLNGVEAVDYTAGTFNTSGNQARNFRLFAENNQNGTVFTNNGLVGSINSVKVYDEIRTEAQITEAFNAGIVAVPEPSSTALLGLGGLALILRRRK